MQHRLQQLSCTPPRGFLVFSQYLSHNHRDTVSSQNRPSGYFDLQQVDHMLGTASGLRAKSVLHLFIAGFATALAGRWALSLLRGGAATGALEQTASRTLKSLNDGLEGVQHTTQMYLSLNESNAAMLSYAFENPLLKKTLLAYLGTGILGYLGANLLQGSQEVWVRREETKIRARLLSRLGDIFKTSIRKKSTTDLELKQEAKTRILSLLSKHGVSRPENYLSENPVLESAAVNRHYFYEPTHRTTQPLQPLSPQSPMFGAGLPEHPQTPETPFSKEFSTSIASDSNETDQLWRKIFQAGIFSFGVLSGWMVMGLKKVFSEAATSLKAATSQNQNRQIFETINAMNLEALFIHRNKFLLPAFLLMTAAGAVGKMFVEGLRAIEVTRANAETEYRYQTHNWTQLDPGFHRIAEEEALDTELSLFERQLTGLIADPLRLQQRIQIILANIGRNSAPKYFPMTPPVGLVDARS